MRTKTITAALCLLGSVAVGCADVGDAADAVADTRSADQLLRESDRTMKALTSVTIVRHVTSATTGNRSTGSLTTDLKGRCTFKSTASYGSGRARMEQIRIGETDYIHPNDMYLEMWGRKTVPAMRHKPWLKSPVSEARGADGLADCAWQFLSSSLGRATRGTLTELDGEPVIPVKVADDETEEGVHTFYVAAEGKPYLLRVDYKDPYFRRVTKYSGFNDRMDIQPPLPADVLDLSTLPQGDS
ncbi:hypothetical protein [Streptomyces neyagawaensis]|uniref:hypothetical protein n=1 Tax=Streptomyces neyagawaensis TaxID=42238 RepID=UPI0006E437E4|nr:hypothetical protein [Streptomyces neyagawaensis]MCL6732968.1 hypothetical protein [Streptomyces neyagawaensis]MDE1684829.1 hypothetical protein [Streptomyces neyagawaensis]